MFGAFLLRFLVYAVIVGLAYQIAHAYWVQNGLDGVDALAGVDALGRTVLFFAPFVLALVGIVARPLALFALFFLVGAMLTAPFALARLGG
ncbi:MAG: hypothetical protein JO140_03285 [Candidatus Eremiobacteraeota bacterium]|nr:hypothetical protein [Candidatus Eremiobacteraeota bacterium]